MKKGKFGVQNLDFYLYFWGGSWRNTAENCMRKGFLRLDIARLGMKYCFHCAIFCHWGVNPATEANKLLKVQVKSGILTSQTSYTRTT